MNTIPPASNDLFIAALALRSPYSPRQPNQKSNPNITITHPRESNVERRTQPLRITKWCSNTRIFPVYGRPSAAYVCAVSNCVSRQIFCPARLSLNFEDPHILPGMPRSTSSAPVHEGCAGAGAATATESDETRRDRGSRPRRTAATTPANKSTWRRAFATTAAVNVRSERAAWARTARQRKGTLRTDRASGKCIGKSGLWAHHAPYKYICLWSGNALHAH
ncbi:hypothetical protein B0H17DRAFT_1148612 [Mycena rosella]|uniref:Uncharacterized protein n=1 Tax=Mycena rosella TaxID=1033263 RepID=A0AAD7C9P6_MYCRO|nr:hypothetical protein B0H17DRAFT_1148612 [Mycena rosella]